MALSPHDCDVCGRPYGEGWCSSCSAEAAARTEDMPTEIRDALAAPIVALVQRLDGIKPDWISFSVKREGARLKVVILDPTDLQ
jgi:hypothetical protein